MRPTRGREGAACSACKEPGGQRRVAAECDSCPRGGTWPHSCAVDRHLQRNPPCPRMQRSEYRFLWARQVLLEQTARLGGFGGRLD